MTDTTIRKIKKYGENALSALMSYCDKSSLQKIPEEQAQEFLSKVERGEIKI